MATTILPSRIPSPSASVKNKVIFGDIEKQKGQRLVIYGSGGIGKTTLACMAPGPVAFIDVDESLPILKSQLKQNGISIPEHVNVTDWQSAISALQSDGWEKIKTIVVDTVTKAEEMAIADTLKNVKRENNTSATSVESYGYGKGYTHVFETFMKLLAALDKHVREGRNVILVAHDCTQTVPNPAGLDWIRYEPRLQNANGKSIRHRVKEWADHVLFVGYDVNVNNEGNDKAKKGKGQGAGTRTLYTSELPTFMAKSRTTSESFDVELGKFDWGNIIK